MPSLGWSPTSYRAGNCIWSIPVLYHLHKCRARIHLQPLSRTPASPGLFVYPFALRLRGASLNYFIDPDGESASAYASIDWLSIAKTISTALGPDLCTHCFWAKSRIVVIDWLAIQLSTERNQIGLCKQCISRRYYSQLGPSWNVKRNMIYDPCRTDAKRVKNQEKCILSWQCDCNWRKAIESITRYSVPKGSNQSPSIEETFQRLGPAH